MLGHFSGLTILATPQNRQQEKLNRQKLLNISSI
jgi:hypothetical protein